MTRKIHTRTGLEPRENDEVNFRNMIFVEVYRQSSALPLLIKWIGNPFGRWCVAAWHAQVYPMVEHCGSEFPARPTVAFTYSSEIWWTHPQCAAAVALGMMNSGNGCLGASAGASIG
jgi:hypothetical protein